MVTKKTKPKPKAKAKPKKAGEVDKDRFKKVAINRKARFEYTIEEVLEAGLVLFGTEVKSLRAGRASIAEAYASHKSGEIWLWNADIPVYSHGNRQNHEPRRGRKLLLSGRQVQKLIGALKVRGVTLIPLSVYFNKRGWAKVEIAIAKGKKQHEKRDVIKEREWKREQGRLMKG
jgi:SsrA-binding protein